MSESQGSMTRSGPKPLPKPIFVKSVAKLAAELADDPNVKMKVELLRVDDILVSLEDTVKGVGGDKITEARGLLQSYL